MIRTQVQLPDELYAQARRLAEQKEISLAEVVRRGLEHLLIIYPPNRASEWQLEPPANTQLRKDPFADPDWRWQANLGSATAHATAREMKSKRK
jgi:hypothetical protein